MCVALQESLSQWQTKDDDFRSPQTNIIQENTIAGTEIKPFLICIHFLL